MSIPHCHVTAHARQRAVERLRSRPGEARHQVAALWASSVKVPPRYAARLSGRQAYTRRKDGISYRLSGSVLLVCRGPRVITLWCISDEQLVDALIWFAGLPWLQA